MDAAGLLDAFDTAAAAVGAALRALPQDVRRARTERPGQYALDLVADDAATAVLAGLPVAVLSEESGWSGDRDAAVTVVLDPVDGSTNAARALPYFATSICALDAEGPLAALVVNHATGVRFRAVRGDGAHRDADRISASRVRRVEDAVLALSGLPAPDLPWKQCRVLGSAALALCDVAAGGIDGFLDVAAHHAPWDYLGGLLVCTEAGAVVASASDVDLLGPDLETRRQILAAGTPELLDTLRRVTA
ncbi:MAG: inositol monophosphatase family protein [Actinomycetes bacterium]